MRCDKVMKRDIQALRPEDDIQHAARTMRDAGIGFMPVIDEAGKVIGTLTDRDIVIRAVAEDRVELTRVGSICTRECIAVRPEDDFSVVEEVMARLKKSRVLV